ncbi:MAG: DUF4136 domain-containing protein, partial [Bacteroidota bacterium]
MENSSISPDKDQYSDYHQRTVYNTIHDELHWLGMKESETPDLLVYVYAMVVNKTESVTDMPSHKGKYGSLVQLNTTIINYDEGTLVLDFVDAKTEKLVWRGTATDVLSSDEKEITKTLKRAIRRLIAKYPPIRM